MIINVNDNINIDEEVEVEIAQVSGSISRFTYPITTPTSEIVSDSTSTSGVVVSPADINSLVKVIDSTKGTLETSWNFTINLGVFKFTYGRKIKQ